MLSFLLSVPSFFGQTVCQPVKYTWQSRQLFHLKRRTGSQIIIVAFFNSPFLKLHLRLMWSVVRLSCSAFPSVSWIYGFLSDNQSLFSLWLFPAFWVSGQPAVESSVGFCPVCRVRVWSWALTALCFPRWTTPSGQIISSRSVAVVWFRCSKPYTVLTGFSGIGIDLVGSPAWSSGELTVFVSDYNMGYLLHR